MSAPAVPNADAFVREPATWYSWLLTGVFIYVVNLQGNFIPFLQEEFGLSYRIVGLHSSAFAAGIILTGLVGERVSRRLGRGKSLWSAVGGLVLGAILLCSSPTPWASIASCLL